VTAREGRDLFRGRTLAKHIIDASRAGGVLDEFLRQWKFELTDDIAGTALEFRLNREVDALCRRLADNPDLEIKTQPRSVRALLSGRTLLFLANSVEEPDAEIMADEGAWTDGAIRAGVWGLLAKARLPSKWDGKPFDPGSS
jgi:hypothetical protein